MSLVVKLSVGKNFTLPYSKSNRLWFVRKTIDFVREQGIAESLLEEPARRIILAAKKVVKDEQNFVIGISSSRVRLLKSRRIHILYGAIGGNFKLLNLSNNNFLDFIARRRLRVVVRMLKYVNPNSNGYFRYNSSCDDTEKSNTHRLNDKAESILWTKPANAKPWSRFWQINQGADLSDAITKLFIKKSDPCKGNLVDCPVVIAILFLDSFFEAQNPDDLLNTLRKPDRKYLVINNPNSSTTNFMTDDSSKSLFEKKTIDISDMQIGDHLYIYNHPLYRSFFPSGAWQGEHAIVSKVGLQNTPDQKKLNRNEMRKRTKFTGHGLDQEQTLTEMYLSHLADLNTRLSFLYKAALIHLKFKETGVVDNGNGQVQQKNASVKHIEWFVENGDLKNRIISAPYQILKYTVDIRYTKYTERNGIRIPKSKTKTAQDMSYVIAHSQDESHFYFEQASEIDEVENRSNKKVIRHPLKFVRHGISGFIPDQWALTYLDKSEGDLEKKYFLFQRFQGRFRRRGLTLNDMPLGLDDFFEAPFAARDPLNWEEDPTPNGVYVTTPKTSTDASYIKFLEENGAIIPS
ncbi:MAG: hypothetical protein AB3N14_14195 [Flavobacteriaceae bacterium]